MVNVRREIKTIELQIEYSKKTATWPYEKLVNEKLGRTLTEQEIEAVKIHVEYGNAIFPSDEGYDDAIRSVIICGDIQDVLRFASHDHATLEMIQGEEHYKRELERLGLRSTLRRIR